MDFRPIISRIIPLLSLRPTRPDVGGYRLPLETERGPSGEERVRLQVHRGKPKGKPMPETVRKTNVATCKVRSQVAHIFRDQKHRTDLCVCTITRATNKIGLANPPSPPREAQGQGHARGRAQDQRRHM